MSEFGKASSDEKNGQAVTPPRRSQRRRIKKLERSVDQLFFEAVPATIEALRNTRERFERLEHVVGFLYDQIEDVKRKLPPPAPRRRR